jgi:hypothetical protein
MDSLSDNFLASATLAQNEHRDVRGCYLDQNPLQGAYYGTDGTYKVLLVGDHGWRSTRGSRSTVDFEIHYHRSSIPFMDLTLGMIRRIYISTVQTNL